MKRYLIFVFCVVIMPFFSLSAFAEKEKIVIYTAASTTRIEDMQTKLSEKFPDYEFVIEYLGTSKLAAKLLAEGTDTDVDIIHDLAYTSLIKLEEAGYLADLSEFDYSRFVEDANISTNFMVECRTGGAIVLNTSVMEDLDLPEPTCYEDLLKPEYKGLVSMADPKASGTGYMFLKNLVNVWGEEKAFDYFEKLTDNILQYTSSGNGSISALIQEEVAIGLCMTTTAVRQINEGDPLKILFFEEGSPYAMYGQAIPKGKDERPEVKEVFEYLTGEFLVYTVKKWVPEKIFIENFEIEMENYPENIIYGDMSNDTLPEKERLLEKWNWT